MSAATVAYLRITGGPVAAARTLELKTGKRYQPETIKRWAYGKSSPPPAQLDAMRRTIVYDSFPAIADELLEVLDLHKRPLL